MTQPMTVTHPHLPPDHRSITNGPRSRFKLKFSPDKVDTMIIQAAWLVLLLVELVGWVFLREKKLKNALNLIEYILRCVCVS